jgi:2-haloacid dehalogenase
MNLGRYMTVKRIMPEKTIIFDFGGVLIDWNPRYVYQQIFATREETDWFLGNICTSEWNLTIDAGKPFARAVNELAEKHPEWFRQIEAFHLRWEEMLGGEISESVDILSEIQKEGFRVYGLTNWSAETFPIAFEKYKFLQTLDGIVVSGREKLIKPDPEIFKVLLNRYQLQAGNCIFIDDNPDNINIAAQLGFNVLHFTSSGKLREDLIKSGILSGQ